MNLVHVFMRKARSARHLFLLRVRPPARRRRISRVLALTRPRPLAKVREGQHEADQIRDHGFAALGMPFDEAKLKRIRRALEGHKCIDAWRPELGEFALADAPADSNNVHIVKVEEIREVVELANDPRILAIVSNYLGCRPTLDDVLAWWSLPGRPAPLEEQFFHRDNDSIRFLKLFIYLTDVTEESGPHVFVKGSHRTNHLLEAGRRYTDEEVEAAGLAPHVVRFTGQFGTAFIEDTYGLHKGHLPKSEIRLVLQVRYTMIPSIWAKKGAKDADVSGFDRYTNRMIGPRSPQHRASLA